MTPPHSTLRTPLYEALLLLEISRTLFFSPSVLLVNLHKGGEAGVSVAHHEPATYLAGVPAIPSGQSQTACGFGHPGGPQ